MNIQAAMDQALLEANSPGDAVDKFYIRLQEPGFDWGNPDAQEFDYVMSTFAKWVMSEKKKVNDGPTAPIVRAKIIGFIQEYVKSRPTAAFLHIHPAVFGIQLAMRVRRPRTIDQDGSCLCGAVAVMYNMAKLQPMEFAQFALDLFFKGHAMFGAMEIEPSNEIKQNYRLRKNNIRWGVDYVTLVSLRQCTFLSDKLKLGVLRGADETTLPGQMGAWLMEAGYRNVEDHTFFAKNQRKLVKTFAAKIGQPVHLDGADGDAQAKADRKQYASQNLDQASRALRNGKIVVLFSDGEIGEMLKGNAVKNRTAPTSLGSHHWMAMRKITIFGDTMVKLKAITWGHSYQGTLQMDQFIPRYNGFISAEP
jgi:hypothetical protein